MCDQAEWYKALYLAERPLNNSNESTLLFAEDLERAGKKLERWKQPPLFSKGSYFKQRLVTERLDEKVLLALLAETPQHLKQRYNRPPAWLEPILASLQAYDCSPATYPTAHEENPFKDGCLRIVKPFLDPALKRLEQGLQALKIDTYKFPFDILQLRDLFFQNLSEQIPQLFLRTLALEVNLARIKGNLTGETPTERFTDFIEQLSQPPRLKGFYLEYPVLTRLVHTVIENWVNFNLEFAGRLLADWPILNETFFRGRDPGHLVKLEGGVGDSHRQGRSVLKLEFSTGLKLIYKPRSLGLDVNFQDLLDWLNEEKRQSGLNFPDFRLIDILDRGVYGWSEFVEARTCQTAGQVEQFYRQLGGYLALLYSLEAVDFHAENLIADAANPVLIDLEALFHPRFEKPAGWPDPALGAFTNSVLRVGLLPERVDSSEQEAGYDISGVGNRPGQVLAKAVPVMEEPGTDQMRLVYKRFEVDTNQNRPTLQGTEVDFTQYREPFVEGFKTIYSLILKTRAELLAGPLQPFKKAQIRLIALPTMVYDKIYRVSLHPNFLRDALERERIIDRVWLSVETQPARVRLIEAEKLDLQNGDIPFFYTQADSCDVFDSRGKPISNFLSESGFTAATRRLAQLCPADLNRQAWLIHSTYATIPLGKGESSWRSSRISEGRNTLDPKQALSMAEAIGKRLLELSFREGDCINWIGLSLMKEREWKLLPVGFDLYNGTSGIVLFLAYLGVLTEDKTFTTAARSGLKTIRQQLKQLNIVENTYSVGPFGGLSAPIYLFMHLAILWNEQTWLDKAEELAALLPKHIAADKDLDLLDGSAGCISTLLGLYKLRSSPQILGAALLCGEQLMTQARRSELWPGVSWQNTIPARAPLVGFSHGVAGIATSLFQLARQVERSDLRQMAEEALRYERSTFLPKQQNWPDFRTIAYGSTHEIGDTKEAQIVAFSPKCMTTWCHGAPGIGLARLAARPYLEGDPLIDEEIRAAVKTTIQNGFGLNHSLCHGDAGNLDLLLEVSRKLPDEETSQAYTREKSRLVESITRFGWITGNPLGIESPGLMSGLAGIGYQLLRLAFPAQVPSVLLLQPPI